MVDGVVVGRDYLSMFPVSASFYQCVMHLSPFLMWLFVRLVFRKHSVRSFGLSG